MNEKENKTQKVEIVNINMKFKDMVIFILKVFFASIPTLIIISMLFIITFFLLFMFGVYA